jgi:hypothetical protein
MATTKKQQTMHIEHTTSPIIRCRARKDFTLLGQEIKQNETFYMVRSSSGDGQYHLVHWGSEREAWRCSCGAGYKKHAHVAAVNVWIKEHVCHKPAVVLVAQSKATAQSVIETPAAGVDTKPVVGRKMSSVEASMPAWMLTGRSNNGTFAGRGRRIAS